jgi:hypothetical protein
MKKVITLFFITCSILFTSCEKDNQLGTPKSMVIESILLTNYPVVYSNGNSFDPSSGADIFLTISKGSNCIESDYLTGYIENCNGSSLTYTPTGNAYLSDLDREYSLCLFDYDGSLTGNDFMGGLGFRPIDKYDVNNRNKVYLTNSSGTLELTVSWTY